MSTSFNLITIELTHALIILTHTGEDQEIVEQDMSLQHAPSLGLSAAHGKSKDVFHGHWDDQDQDRPS